jgi:hypothetical protein
MVDTSTVSVNWLDPLVEGLKEVLPLLPLLLLLLLSCCSSEISFGAGRSVSAFKQNDTVNGVISVIQSSNRRLLELSVDRMVESREDDLNVVEMKKRTCKKN